MQMSTTPNIASKGCWTCKGMYRVNVMRQLDLRANTSPKSERFTAIAAYQLAGDAQETRERVKDMVSAYLGRDTTTSGVHSRQDRRKQNCSRVLVTVNSSTQFRGMLSCTINYVCTRILSRIIRCHSCFPERSRYSLTPAYNL